MLFVVHGSINVHPPHNHQYNINQHGYPVDVIKNTCIVGLSQLKKILMCFLFFNYFSFVNQIPFEHSFF
jgi:hypothetical protein